jgi:hypothetical protein
MTTLGSDWRYHIVINNPEWPLAQEWCEENIGPFGEQWYKLGIDILGFLDGPKWQTEWYFKREQDAVLFQLKWA